MRNALFVLAISLCAPGMIAAPTPLGTLFEIGPRRGLEQANITSPEFLGGPVYLQSDVLPGPPAVVDPAEMSFSETRIASALCSTELQLLD